jgi:lysozyme
LLTRCLYLHAGAGGEVARLKQKAACKKAKAEKSMKTTIRTSLGFIAALALSFTAQANNTTHSLLGVDVSHYQGYITWSSVYGDGVRYAFAQSSSGTATTDSDFSGNMSRGKGAGLQMGAYHFAYPAEGCPSVQANHFWNVAGSHISADGKSVEPMVDCEEFSGVGCGEGSYTTWYNDFAADANARTGLNLRMIIYVSACNACYLNTGIALGAWIADYNGENLYTGNPWSTCSSCNRWGSSNNWTYWQVSSSGAISGISGSVDLDAYNGTLAELTSWQGV